MAKKVNYPEHLIDSHIRKLAEALVVVIKNKSLDVDGVVLTHEEASEIATKVMEEVK